MDVFYEESAVNQNAEKGMKRYKVLHIISWVFLILAILFLVLTLFHIPVKPRPERFETQEQYQAAVEMYPMYVSLCLFLALLTSVFISMWVAFGQFKKRVNISYDYIFVSGELRIAKVFNINRRKLVDRINAEEIIQIGDVDNTSYERLASSPDTKVVYCTPNVEAGEGKFFMYILHNSNGKKLYVLEARELLLMNIMKFARRSVLESDYVMQERKQQRTV